VGAKIILKKAQPMLKSLKGCDLFFNIVTNLIIALLSFLVMGSRQTRIRPNDKTETVNEPRLEKIVEENF